MLFIVGGALAFFFEFLLLSKKNKSLPDKLLAIWMFLIGLHLLVYYLIDSGVAVKHPVIYGIIGALPLVHGPLLYLYTLALTGRMSRWKSIQLLHFTPVLVFYLVSIPFFLMSVEEQKQFIQALVDLEGPIFYRLGPVWILVSAISYQSLALALFRKHKRNLMDQYSYSDEKINLNWLRYLIIGLAVVWGAVIASYMMLNVLKDDDLIYTAVVLFVIFFGYFGVRQGNIFITPPESLAGSTSGPESGSPASADQKKRYEKSGLKEEVAEKLEKQLKVLMEEDKLFLDDTLTLVKIAEMLNISPTYLSQVINERFNRNFYDFINSYRVREFKEILKEPSKKNYTILSLAYEVGFNSKSSFNKYFKQATGQTPSEYLKSAS